jgi:hypothetical protein
MWGAAFADTLVRIACGGVEPAMWTDDVVERIGRERRRKAPRRWRDPCLETEDREGALRVCVLED